MAPSKIQLRDLCRNRSVSYAFAANLYHLIGFREAYFLINQVEVLSEDNFAQGKIAHMIDMITGAC